jgi:hypothetical protein
LLHFGESYRHFHALIAARSEDVPPALRGGALLQLLTGGRDPAAAAKLAGRVRSAYADMIGDDRPARSCRPDGTRRNRP